MRFSLQRMTHAALGLTALAMAAIPAQSMAVTITTNAIVSEASVINNGNVIFARSYGGGEPSTVNGIDFSTVALGGVTVGFSGFSTCGGDFSNHFAPGSGLDRILSGCAFQHGPISTMTLGGLTVGAEYTVQQLWANTLNTTGRNSRIFTGGETVDFSFAASTPRNIMTTFTATSTTQAFLLGTGSTAEPARFQMNALVISGPAPVPAPATLALLGLGLLLARARARR